MKLWLISQDVNNNWDTFDSAVVAAESEEEARNTYPEQFDMGGKKYWNGSKWMWSLKDGRVIDHGSGTWTEPDNVEVQFLADGYEGQAGTVCASFNAG